MNGLIRTIKETISGGSARYVFPSEIAASYWRKEALRITGKRAVRSDRFLSWDRFKESWFSVHKREKPANTLVRSLFAARILQENADTVENTAGVPPLFRSLIHPEYAANSRAFLPYFVSILPSLGALPALQDVLADAPSVPLEDDLRDDLFLLLERYQTFLSENGLFEPSFEPLVFPEIGYPVYVVFPQVLEDIEEYRASLEAAQNVTLIYGTGNGPSLTVFENALHEIRGLMNTLLSLLEAGEGPSSIAITAASEECADHIEREAIKYSIPIIRVRGRPLTEYPAGRLFNDINRCVEDDFSLDSLKQLLLNRGYPWKGPDLGKRLVRFGIDYFCLRDKKVWMRHLSRVGAGKLLGFFKSITGYMTGITTAKSFSELKRRLNGFVERFLDNDGWEEIQLKVFQTCFQLVDDLNNAAEECAPNGADLALLNPFSLFLSSLAERIYVPPKEYDGIPLYPYRVAAGIYPEYHFVVGASHEAVSITANRYPFLREDHKEKCGLTDIDFTEDFLELYGVSGKNVSVSCSRETDAGRRLVPGYFLSRKVVREEEGTGPRAPAREGGLGPSSQGTTAADRYLLEQALWSGDANGETKRDGITPEDGATGTLLHPLQKAGFLSLAATGFSSKSTDFTRTPVEDGAVRETLLDQQTGDDGPLRFSHNHIAEYQNCSFFYLLSYVLGIEEEDYETAFDDPRLAGSFLHEVLYAFFARLRKIEERFDPTRTEEYAQLIEECVKETARRWEEEEAVFFPPVWDGFIEKSMVQCRAFLEAEAETFPGHTVAGLEYTTDLTLKEKNVRLKGRVDRLSSGAGEVPGGRLSSGNGKVGSAPLSSPGDSSDDRPVLQAAGPLAVIDYKKRITFSKRDYIGNEYLPVSYQLPFYVYLLEAEGAEIGCCSYYDITNGHYKHLYRQAGDEAPQDARHTAFGGNNDTGLHASIGGPRPWLDRQGLDRLITLMKQQLGLLIEGVGGGDYRSSKQCASCSFRTICRERYILD